MTTYYVSVHDLLLRVQELEVNDDDKYLNQGLSLEQDYTYYKRDTRRDSVLSPLTNIQLEQKACHVEKSLVAQDRPTRTKTFCN